MTPKLSRKNMVGPSCKRRAVVVAQLAERLLPIPKIRSSNPLICKRLYLRYLLWTVEKTKKEAGNVPLLKIISSTRRKSKNWSCLKDQSQHFGLMFKGIGSSIVYFFISLSLSLSLSSSLSLSLSLSLALAVADDKFWPHFWNLGRLSSRPLIQFVAVASCQGLNCKQIKMKWKRYSHISRAFIYSHTHTRLPFLKGLTTLESIEYFYQNKN